VARCGPDTADVVSFKDPLAYEKDAGESGSRNGTGALFKRTLS